MLRKSRWPVVQWQDTGLWSLEWRFESSPASQNVFAARDEARLWAVVYLWSESDPATTKVRVISAREATEAEIRHYQESL